MFKKVFTLLALLFTASVAMADEVYLLPSPCRVLDTRNVGGVLAANTELAVAVRGTPGAAQGGETGCGVPEWATGAIVSLVAIQPAGAGYARLWAAGSTQPLETALVFDGADLRNDGLSVKLGTTSDLTLESNQDSHFVLGLIGWTGPGATESVSGQVFDLYYGGSAVTEVVLTNGGRVYCEPPFMPISVCNNLGIGDPVSAIGHPKIVGGVIVVVAHELTSP